MAAPNHEILAGHRVRHYVITEQGKPCYMTAVLDANERPGMCLIIVNAPELSGFNKSYFGIPGCHLGRRVDQALLPIYVLQKLTTELQSLD